MLVVVVVVVVVLSLRLGPEARHFTEHGLAALAQWLRPLVQIHHGRRSRPRTARARLVPPPSGVGRLGGTATSTKRRLGAAAARQAVGGRGDRNRVTGNFKQMNGRCRPCQSRTRVWNVCYFSAAGKGLRPKDPSAFRLST